MTFVLCALLCVYVLPAAVVCVVIRRVRRKRERLAARRRVGRLGS